jgi:hypothetical protein
MASRFRTFITTSYLTHEAIADHLAAENDYDYPGPLLLSPGRSIGLRMIPIVRDSSLCVGGDAAANAG